MTNVGKCKWQRRNGKRKMIGQRSHRKLNRGGWTEKALGVGVWNAVGIGCAAFMIASTDPFSLSVQAEPATLRSPDATVYEQTSEGSNAVGNLVEGGSFDYIGDVTAEDGSVWHQITTAGGVNGYIRGDREIEMGEAEPAPEGQEGQEAPAGEGGNGEPAANPPEGGGEIAPAEEGVNPGEGAGAVGEEPRGNGEGNVSAPGNDNRGDREEPGEEEAPEEGEIPEDDAEGAPEDEDAVPVFNMQNNQTKKYVVDNAQKIKERESFTEVDVGTKASKSRGLRIDKALIAGIAVVLLCGGMIQVCWTRMKRMRKGVSEGSISVSDGNRNRTHRKAERKKHSQKKKSTKIIQGKKRI